jgi:hypothetical protein
MREIRTSGSTRGRWVADSIRCSPSYSTGHNLILSQPLRSRLGKARFRAVTGGGGRMQARGFYWPSKFKVIRTSFCTGWPLRRVGR